MNSTRKSFSRNLALLGLLLTPNMLVSQSPPANDPPVRIDDGDLCEPATNSVAFRMRGRLNWTFTSLESGADVSSCEASIAAASSPGTASRTGLPISRHDSPALTKTPEKPSRSGSSPNFDETVSDIAPLASPRKVVLAILQQENICSTWFSVFDPQIVSTFLSLNYQIEKNGPQQVIRAKTNGGDWIEYGPYIARVMQGSGPGATITINGNGAFFRHSGDIYGLEWSPGMAIKNGNQRFIHVGPYLGGTLRAQTITLLHELGHVVGAIPEDGSSRFGPGRSQENTAVILRHCKRSVDSVVRAQIHPGSN